MLFIFSIKKENFLQKSRGGRPSGNSNSGSYNSGGNSRTWDPEIAESSIAVPAGKCGVIIGKGIITTFRTTWWIRNAEPVKHCVCVYFQVVKPSDK